MVLCVIPARYASTRFPGKPLALLAGKPILQHCWERTRLARSINRVLIATDDTRIADVARAFGAEVALTRADHPSGTDRVAEAAARIKCSLVVNVQGDEPLIDPRMIDAATGALLAHRGFDISTLCHRITDPADIQRPQVVKVVRRMNGEALYFSRHGIPFDRDGSGLGVWWKHIGLYVYRPAALRRIVRLPVSPLEGAEQLEQLRALENGLRILAVETPFTSTGIDTPADLARLRRSLRAAPRVIAPSTSRRTRSNR
jgi:3-deoxy-manno-octulosonate cytidylyltransferase (CMP-KDO synthetase)